MYAMLLAHNADDKALLSLALQRAGLAVTTANDLERAMQSWLDRPADLVLLSLALEPMAQVRRVRAETEVPLVIITDHQPEKVHYDLLEAGADLVVYRPFSASLLIAQVRALLRRGGNVPISTLPALNLPDLTLDPAARTVTVTGRPPRRLTHLEFRLLETLWTNQGQILPTETIVERVWGYSGQGDKDLVRGLVSRLRSKVELDPRTPCYIVTAPGVGYSFDPQGGRTSQNSHS